MEKEGDPQAELLNRLKFGIEGAAFTGAFGAAGKLIGKMRNSGGDNKAVKGTFNKGVDKLAGWMRSRGILPQEGFDIKMQKIGAEAKDTLGAEIGMRDIDNIATKITNSYKKVAIDKVVPGDAPIRSKILAIRPCVYRSYRSNKPHTIGRSNITSAPFLCQ
jgi:hypothetical protein